MKSLTNTLAILVFSLLSLVCVNAQELNEQQSSAWWNGAVKVRISERTGKVDFIRFADEAAPDSARFMQLLSQKLGTTQNDHWRLKTILLDPLGRRIVKLQHYHLGFLVDGSVITLQIKLGRVLVYSGSFYEVSEVHEKLISEEVALQNAINHYPGAVFNWQVDSINAMANDMTEGKMQTFFPKGERVYVFPQFDVNRKSPKLSWSFEVWGFVPEFQERIYIDAQTGEILAIEDLHHTGDAKGKAKTKYSDTMAITSDSISTTQYRLRETGRGNGIETYNMNKGTNYGAATDFWDTDNFWNNVNVNKDEVATDAHVGSEWTYDYFKIKFNRNSFDNNGAKIRSFIHYGNNYNNAFWNGYVMTYGDGNGTTFTPLTSLDVAGHEIAHAVTTYTANLVYSYESGALNESFSDIFGNMVERYARPKKYSWKIGEDITPSGNGIRNMSNPNANSNPDTYKGTFWISSSFDNGGVHYNSGVQNFWFYLLSEGGNGTNDIGQSYKVDSIGINRAEQIAYRNLAVYLGKNSQYADARFYSIQAAVDLYGYCSKPVISTTNAWHAVGVGNKYDSAYVKADFIGDTLFCSINAVAQFNHRCINASKFYWSASNGDTSTQPNPKFTFKNYGTYGIKLVAQSCFKNKYDSITKTAYVKVDSTMDICKGYLMPLSGWDTFYACEGFVYDQGGVGFYPALSKARITIITPFADSIKFRFKEFGTEDKYDSLYVYNHNYSLLGGFTGFSLPFGGNWVTVPGNAFSLRHFSDQLVEGIGYKVEFKGFRKLPLLLVTADTAICKGDSILLVGKALGNAEADQHIYWPGVANNDSVWVRPNDTTKYMVKMIDVCNKQVDSAFVTISVKPDLKAYVMPDTTVCFNSTATLRSWGIGGRNTTYQFNWNNGLGNGAMVNFTATQDSTFMVVLSDQCTEIPDTNYVNVKIKSPLSLSLARNLDTICLSNIVKITATPSGGETAGYNIVWNGNLNDSFIRHFQLNNSSWITANLNDGCTGTPAMDSIYIQVRPGLNFTMSNDTSICVGSSVVLNTQLNGGLSSGYNYSWGHGPSTSSVSVTPLAPGYYVVSGSDGCSPSIKDSIYINWLPALNVFGSPDTTVCKNTNFNVRATATGGKGYGYSYLWNGGKTGSMPVFNIQKDSIVRVIVDDGCTVKKDTAFIDIKIHNYLSTQELFKREICDGESTTVTINRVGSSLPFILNWGGINQAGNNVVIKPNGFTIYNYTIDDGCAKIYADSLWVQTAPLPNPNLSVNKSQICEGQTVIFSNSSIDATTETWVFNDGPTLNGNPVNRTFTNPGNYSVKWIGSTTKGCKDSAILNTNISVLPLPVANFSADLTEVILGASKITFTNFSTGANSYMWDFGDGNSSTNAAPVHNFTDTGLRKVVLTAIQSAGCQDTSSIFIRIRDFYKAYIPSAFSPNADGNNDYYKPTFISMKSYEMEVFTRWGELLYKGNQSTPGWDGKDRNGKELPAGVYIIKIRAIDLKNQHHYENLTMHLIR